jgi:hypothetical protein
MTRRLAPVLLAAALLAGCASSPSGEVGEQPAAPAGPRADKATARVVLAPDQIPGAFKGTRVILPAAALEADGTADGILVVGGVSKGDAVLSPVEGLVVVDADGRVLIDMASALAWGKDLFIPRGGKGDLNALLARAAAEGASVFQAPMLLDGGRALSGAGVVEGAAARLTLYRDGAGSVGVLSSGAARPTLEAHLVELASLGATEAVALDPAGLGGVVMRARSAGVPLGDRAGGYLVLDMD